MNGYVLQFLQVYIEPKAKTLSSTAGNQSKSELGSTNLTDLQKTSYHPQDNLSEKAGELASKAQALNQAAKRLERAAKDPSPLADLKSTATKLRDAAGSSDSDSGSGSGSGLHQAAEKLAGVGPGQANGQATKVIEAFETVETQYEALMNEADTKKLTNDPAVIAVVSKFFEVNTTYYQMLITYRIQQKAEAFHIAANALKNAAQQAAQQQSTNPKLKALNSAASVQMTTLVGAAEKLKGINVGATPVSTIVTYYLEVEKACYALEKMEEFTAALKDPSVPQVQTVKTKFEILKKSYENVLRLRVQELSDKALALHGAAQTLSSAVVDLKTEAEALRDVASKDTRGQEGLKQKAEALVQAINTSTDADAQAKEVITEFDEVETKYNLLTANPKYEENKDNPKVIAVVSAYKLVKHLYYRILNVTKANLLKNAVGNGGDGLILDKAVTLHTNAKALAEAKELRAKPDQGDTEQEQLKKLAETLATAVGANERTEGLRKALKDLSNANATNIVKKAQNVINKYNAVDKAFKTVKALETQYTTALTTEGETNKYTNVTSAFQALQFCPP